MSGSSAHFTGSKLNIPFGHVSAWCLWSRRQQRSFPGVARHRLHTTKPQSSAMDTALTCARAELYGEGGRLGKFHRHRLDFSMKQKYYNLAWKAKVLPEENIGKKELFCSASLDSSTLSFYKMPQPTPARRSVLAAASFSFTIRCLYCHVVKNPNSADLNPFKLCLLCFLLSLFVQ